MFNKNYLIEYHDMFNKYNLIKKINKDYKLCYDRKNKLFIIINSANNNEICLKFDNILINIEKLLQKTLIKNCDTLFKEIELSNQKLEEEFINYSKTKLTDSILETKKYLCRTNKILPSDINKLIGVKDV